MFTDLVQAMAIAKSNIGLAAADMSRDVEIMAILQASAGKDKNGVMVYRPYIVAAYFLPLWGAIGRGMLASADGATWLKPSDFLPFIQSLLTLQESSDCGLTLDPCWTVNNLRIRLTCGCEADSGGLLLGLLGATVI